MFSSLLGILVLKWGFKIRKQKSWQKRPQPESNPGPKFSGPDPDRYTKRPLGTQCEILGSDALSRSPKNAKKGKNKEEKQKKVQAQPRHSPGTGAVPGLIPIMVPI